MSSNKRVTKGFTSYSEAADVPEHEVVSEDFLMEVLEKNKGLWLYLAGRYGSWDAAEDIVQESMIRIVRILRDGTLQRRIRRTTLKYYLGSIVKNTAVTFVRKQARYELAARDLARLTSYVEAGPEDFVTDMVVVERALKDVPEGLQNYQEVLLHFMDEVSLADSAAKLSVSRETLRKRRRAALRIVRESIGRIDDPNT